MTHSQQSPPSTVQARRNVLAERAPNLRRAGPHTCSGRESGRCEALRPLCGTAGAASKDQFNDPEKALDNPHTRASLHVPPPSRTSPGPQTPQARTILTSRRSSRDRRVHWRQRLGSNSHRSRTSGTCQCHMRRSGELVLLTVTVASSGSKALDRIPAASRRHNTPRPRSWTPTLTTRGQI